MRIGVLEHLLIEGKINVGDASALWGVPGRYGLKYNWHEYGQNIFVLPFYLFMRRTGYAFYAVNIISTALTAVLLLNTLRLLGFRLRASTVTALLFGTATLAWHYASKVAHEHALAIMFVVAGFYFALRYHKGYGSKNLVYCVLSVGFGFVTRHDVVLSVLPLVLYFYLEGKGEQEGRYPLRKAALVAGALFLPFLLSVLYYNYARFGSVFVTGQIEASHNKQFGIEYLPRGFLGALLSPGRSIFLFSPVIVLMPFFLRRFRQRIDRNVFAVIFAYIGVYSLFYFLHYSFDGEWCFGPRYFLVIIPFLMMPLVVMLEEWSSQRNIMKSVIVAVIIFSIVSQVVFATSNTWLSNVIKYGISDDSLPELSKSTRRHFGAWGSWGWLKSFFILKYSQFFNQFKIFWYSLRVSIDPSYIMQVYWKLKHSDAPFMIVYLNLFKTLDVWWMQMRGVITGLMAGALAGLGSFALFRTLRLARRFD